MNLLLIHNNYGIYSGEEAVVDQQISLFQSMGHVVSIYRKTTEGVRGTFWGSMRGLLCGFYSPGAIKDIKRLMKTNKPDLVIIHNLYPFISPSILKYIKKAGIPIVMTIHNYRLMCPTGLFLRDSKPCELCLGGHEWNCIKHNCEHSVSRSIGYAGRNWYARITKAYMNNVDKYACITHFQVTKLVQSGFSVNKMKVIPNFLDTIFNPDNETLGEYVAISGRLSKEKGIDLVLEVARRTPQINYCFAGSFRPGEKPITEIPGNCVFIGHLSQQDLPEFYRKSRFLLIASRWYEGFPMTILEASLHGKPAIGPGHAGFLEIIDSDITGLHFIPGDLNDLTAKVSQLWNDSEACLRMGKQAFLKLQSTYSVDAVKGQWEELFHELI